MPASPIVTRFAPSPTGGLHLGHAHSALFGWLAARQAGGQFLLRLEDIDPVRCRPEFAEGILEDLAWLGLTWDGPVRRQSEHMEDYARALGRLDEMSLLYPCFCTRKDIQEEIARAGHAPHGPDGPLYPGLCRALPRAEADARMAAGEPYALRLDMHAAIAAAGPLTWHDRGKGEIVATPEIFGDVVLARKDVPTSYHLAVTVDDYLQGITLVTRGEDLFEATHIHRLLQALLGLHVPDWHHHRLLTDETGRRFAKRDKSLTLQALRESGKTPAEVQAMAGFVATG
ncbi:tRNA glutamyl-Q(34) synthetase GluQRS [Telmatospirillum sp. J64-1]|uniref:tRNA glutamyl-Q(34) synthetase GluQRS n=1 Tax=Telmatospirillum sp. J64-1 TaxID=2502183 RepID=UPI00115F3F3D|nr:tRNA glutamyl-Q(34) synthetase GluQRS [Telmatospirillum sp. J64-1]